MIGDEIHFREEVVGSKVVIRIEVMQWITVSGGFIGGSDLTVVAQ